MKLIELSGRAGDIGLQNIDVENLDPMDRGIVLLGLIAKIFPGITWEQLPQLQNDSRMMGLGDWLGRQGRRLQNGLKDGLDVLGEIGGSTLRLLTDKEVMSGLQSYGAGYATGGQSLALEGMADKIFGGMGDFVPQDTQEQVKKLLAAFGGAGTGGGAGSPGGSSKQIPKEYVYLGIGGLVLVTVLMLRK